MPSTEVTRHTIAILQVSQILQGVRGRGVDVQALLRRAGIVPALLDSPRRGPGAGGGAGAAGVLRAVAWVLLDLGGGYGAGAGPRSGFPGGYPGSAFGGFY